MGIIKKIVLFIAFFVMGGAALAAFPAEIYADTINMSDPPGQNNEITINCSNALIEGSSDINHIIINTASGQTATVTLRGVEINLSSESDAAAISITGDGNAVIVLDKNSILHSGDGCAGIEKNNSGFLEIQGYGSLTATGGADGAGIGGGRSSACSNITITGGTVSANGGKHGAGIGGGRSGAGSNITITGGTVSANGGENGAGIGGGYERAGSDITITGGTVSANGGESGAGIGGGFNAAGSNITIEGGEVTSAGGESGAGIGGGEYKAGSDITIKGGTVSSTGGNGGAGIGGGFKAAGSNITIEGGEVSANGGEYGTGIGGGQGGEGSHITITAGTVSANGGESGAGIGGGYERAGSDITITGGTVSANGGESGAGIGGGYGGEGLAITITGGEVTATGGLYGAGIGGGRRGGGNERSGFGSNITIVGGTVISAGGKSGAGIGGGNNAEGSGITISNNAIVRTAGGSAYSTYGVGAAIGDGGKSGSVSGNSCSPDVSGLSDSGYAYLYNPGTTIEEMKNGTVDPYRIIIAPKTITFDPNGGTVTPTSGTTGTDGILASLPAPTRENYRFDGWFSAAEGGTKVTASTVFSSNETVYAHWIYAPPMPSPSPSPTSSPEPTPSPSPTPSLEPTPSPAPAPEPSPTPSPAPEPTPSPAPEAPKEAVITVSDNKPMSVSTESRGDFMITYAHEIPFFGKGKPTVENFGGTFTVSKGTDSYKVTKIKVNKKKHLIQITGLEGADKDTVKAVKKATKGSNGLSFKVNPYYVRDTDDVTTKPKKDGSLKSVKVKINGKDYKAKKEEYEYDSASKLITFKGENLAGSCTAK